MYKEPGAPSKKRQRSITVDKTLKLIGRNSNEIYFLRYPSVLLGFCDYDLSYFAEKAVEACSEAQKTGQIDFDLFAELKRDIQTSHCYIEHHIRTIYEKIPIDCYIDFLCRRDSIGTGTLWNRYVSCRTPFEKMIFQRLCELRYNRAINEWLNILRVKDYAVSKIDFVFPDGIKSASEAAARRNYFDLMFSVTASEMGCRLEELGQTKVFTLGRLPNSPFMFPTISKDIVRNVLSDFDYSDDYSDIKDYSGISDEIAMDAFSRMKNGLAAELSSYNIARSKMEKYDKIYMPCSLKAVIDLEIDAIIEAGGYLALCKRCGRRYYRDKDYNEDYCSYLHNGKSCLDIYLEENPPKRMTEELEEKSRAVTDEVYAHVGSTMNTKEYENWYSYMTAMKGKVQTGEISPEEFDDFLDYSLKVDISRSKPIVEVPKASSGKDRIVKPFVPERIERSSISAKRPEEPEEPELAEFAEFTDSSKKQHQDGFFVSPTVARRTSERRISHIIRAGESRGDDSYDSHPNPADFRPFGEPIGNSPAAKRNDNRGNPKIASQDYAAHNSGFKKESEPNVYGEIFSGEEFKPAEKPRAVQTENEDSFENQLLAELEALRGKSEQKQNAGGFKPFEETDFGASTVNNAVVSDDDAPVKGQKQAVETVSAETNEKAKSAPRTRVIRKNAAAISAYGKMSGAPVISAPPEMELVSRANADEESYARPPKAASAETAPDTEPFKDIGSIFDVLENSSQEGNDSSRSERPPRERKRRRAQNRGFEAEAGEPVPEWSEDRDEREYPSEVTKQNAPSGIWTEDRDIYHEEERSELDMLKSKKQHTKSNKTKRLVDAIMREPDNNPNVRKK